MKKIQYQLLVKFLKLFIKNTDLNEDQDKILFSALQVINENEIIE